jgi:branched-chain amino acid transport system ATP-binding protein
MLLEVSGLSVAYGQIVAVQAVSFSIAAGSATCLIGANGAGKTTLLKSLAGLLPVRHGHVHHEGEDVTGWEAHRRVRRGIALVPEGRGIFSRLTVEENLDMGAYVRRDSAAIRSDKARVYTLFERLAERRRQIAGTLSGGEQQMLAIGRALMSRPRLLLLDEPSMGLAPIMVQTIYGIIRAIIAEGVTLLLVEQNARLALELCPHGHVMESGCLSLSGASTELLGNPQVRSAYLGE